MKKLIIYFLILLVSVWLGLKIATDPGYLLIAYQKFTIEMPLWLAVVGLILAFLILYVLSRFISNIRALGPRLKSWSRRRRAQNAWQRTQRGLIALAAGDWQRAQKDLVHSLPYSENPLLNYLAAARAAQAQGDYLKRDEYLRLARAKSRLGELALGLTQAELQLHHQQLEQALVTLQHLQQISPNHEVVLRLLKRTYLRLQDWHALELLLPQLAKRHVLTENQLHKLSTTVFQGLLNKANQQSVDTLQTVWDRIPKNLRYEPTILKIYIQRLATQQPDEAEQLLRQAIQKNSDKLLIDAYGKIISNDINKQLRTAEGWLKTLDKNAALLLTLGRLCKANQLWGKARSYFEASLGIAPSTEAYFELATLLEQLGEKERALEYYREGISNIISGISQIQQ